MAEYQIKWKIKIFKFWGNNLKGECGRRHLLEEDILFMIDRLNGYYFKTIRNVRSDKDIF